MNKQTITTLIVVVCIGIVAYLLASTRPENTDQPGTTPSQDIQESKPVIEKVYESETYGLRLAYPDTYFVVEKDVGTPQTPQRAIVFMEDTRENQDFIKGQALAPREGPTAITIDIYPNSEGYSPNEWVKNSTTWTLSDQLLEETAVNGRQGFTYTWTGLYEGTSTVVTTDRYAYVMSVTSISDTDRILKDYQSMLQSVQFLP